MSERFDQVLSQVGLHAPCRDAECNICRGDTSVVGPNPDTLSDEVSEDDYDCPTYVKFGSCKCSTGVGPLCPNMYVGEGANDDQ